MGFFKEAIDPASGNCKGLMIKTLDDGATYEPEERSNNWLKLKKDYMEGMTDSVDLVPVAAKLGKGKRKGKYGVFLLACYDPDNDEFQCISKIGTGFSDEDLATHHAFFSKHTVPKKPSNVLVGEALVNDMDVWFDPCQARFAP